MDSKDVIPGTLHLVDVAELGGADIVMHPKPSSDPQDPLNWSKWRKLLAVYSTYIYTLGIGIATTVQYSILVQISEDTGITLTQLNLGTGLQFLALGWGCLLWQPLALVYGRRGVYILSSLLTLGPMIWTAYSGSVGAWYAHRIILGILASPVESLPEVTVPDLFFAHERGYYMAIYAFLVFGSNFLSPFLSGFVNDSLGWRAVIWFGTIVLACSTIIIFFIMEETMYFRSDLEGVTADGQDLDEALQNQAASGEKIKESADVTVDGSCSPAHSVQQGAAFLPERTYLQKLNLFVKLPNRPSKKEHLTMMYRPLLMFFQFPNVSWAGFLYGSNLSWYNVLNATASSILGSAPYNFPARMVGTAYLSPFVGAFLSVIWSGWFGDKVALYMARRNSGVREPEHRLWTLAVSGIFATAGLILWGVGASQQIHYMGLIFGLGMLTFGVVSGSSTAISYDVDCFKDIAGESMITVIIVRNTFGFAFSYAITPWINNQGLLKTFVAVGMVSLACTGSFLIMVGFGKRLRKWSAPKYWQYAATTLSAH